MSDEVMDEKGVAKRVAKLQQDYAERGAEVFEELRNENPALYLSVMAEYAGDPDDEEAGETEGRRRAPMTVNMGPDDTAGRAVSRMFIKPEYWASDTIDFITHHRDQSYQLNDLIDELSDQLERRKAGDDSRDREILNAQAHTLDALFHYLTQASISNLRSGRLEATDRLMKLALRAQSQCRATLDEMSDKERAVIKQTNINHGQQQVNNFPPNKLLEDDNGERMDSGATEEAGGDDSEVETMGEEHGAEDTRGES